MVNRNTGRKLKVNDAKRLSEEKISDQLVDEHHKMAVQSDKAVIDFFNEQHYFVKNLSGAFFLKAFGFNFKIANGKFFVL